MSAGIYHWDWEQGEDLVMPMIYRVGPQGAEVPVDLSAYSLRMDIYGGGNRLFTLNSADIDDSNIDTVGIADNEVSLGDDGTIRITVSRLLTLEGGPLFTSIRNNTVELYYDIFLRDADNKQRKFMKGTIRVHPSYTKWK